MLLNSLNMRNGGPPLDILNLLLDLLCILTLLDSAVQFFMLNSQVYGLTLYSKHAGMQITPLITLTMVLLSISPCLMKAWRDPKPRMITRWVAYAYSCGFMFGWHVHEKASLHFVIPLAITVLKSSEDARHYFILSIGNFPYEQQITINLSCW